MARRIVRTICKVTVLSCVLAGAIFFLDTRFRVLPHKVHSFLPEYHNGIIITDINYQQCSIPFSSCTAIQEDGWTRVEKNIFLNGNWGKKGFVTFRRKKETEFVPTAGDRVVVDVKLSRKRPAPSDGAGDKDVEWESRPGNLWIKRQARFHADAVITAVEVLFGSDAVEVRQGWQLKEGALDLGDWAPRLTVRRGPNIEVKKPVVMMPDNHRIKIIQVSDLHLSTGVGACRHAAPPQTEKDCEADPRTLDFVRRILDDEKPHLAVLSGDQINGDTAPDVQTALFKFAEPFITRKIPFATILGNHDDESNMSREQIMQLTASLPFSLSEVGPELGPIVTDRKGRAVHEGGAGNYIVEVHVHNRAEHSALTLYLLDTHSYSPNPKVEGYDWIKDYQIQWFKDKVKALKEYHQKYTFMHLSMAFIHIPLPEYRKTGVPMVGERRERTTAPIHNSGFRDAMVEVGISVVSAGHDHANDYCMLDKMWMCYAGGSGFGGYGGYGGYIRRVRLFEFDGPADIIKTWKRLEWGDKGPVDLQTIVNGGVAVAPTT